MKWSIDFSQKELLITTEYGPAFLRLRQIDDNQWAFQGGTIGIWDGKWVGGFDLAGHRYFIKDGGLLVKKSGGRSGFLPYHYKVDGDVLVARLWEDKLHMVKKEFGQTDVEIKGIVYRLSGGKVGTLRPVMASESDHEAAIYARRHSRYLNGLTETSLNQ